MPSINRTKRTHTYPHHALVTTSTIAIISNPATVTSAAFRTDNGINS
eukprot:CAMPEP_0172498904 /NCGR_PEP_ID=MMETSP1066-20121228/119421_1 /TAXON_ID=671091 /ORGANISM="Coscinodiscus wailesii, Strain CCMP2513" /LENGTH=46 /DNA_ID= /DNA_START= /DNA_END= /DNA_ORIENTATION=